MVTPTERPVVSGLRGLSRDRQNEVAIRLAEVVEPLGQLAPLTLEPLALIAQRIKDATDPDEAAAVATLLRRIPALQEAEEPEGPAWFALGAVVAWIYAAETPADSTGERIVNTFVRVEDVLDYAGDRLGVAGICDRLYGAVSDAIRGDDAALRDMRAVGESLVDALRGVT